MSKPDFKYDPILMNALAIELVQDPKIPMGELAEKVGIGRATLFRQFLKRDNLFLRLMEYGEQILDVAIEEELQDRSALEVLNALNQNCLQHWEITIFMIRYWKLGTRERPLEAKWNAIMDGFFLKAQQDGVFRIDIPASTLTEIWISLLTGLIDAGYRGRIARDKMSELIETIFLNGTARKT